MSIRQRFFTHIILFSLALISHADTILRVKEGKIIPVRREILGVNQLAYNPTSYGLLIPGTHKIQPEMLQILKDLGIRSMRYPGGAGGTDSFDWKKSARITSKHQDHLGLLDFLDLCRETNSLPILGLSSFRGSPEEAAEFVEFLNSPNDGKHPWAAKRAELGYPEPFGIRYIEYGNETYHALRDKRITAEKYARNYLAFRAAMKKVDPEIQLGVVGHGEYWNKPVLDVIGDQFDFWIIHIYSLLRKTNGPEYISNFGQSRRLTHMVELLKARLSPKKALNIKIALTEFNLNLHMDKTLTSALINAEFLNTLLRTPEFFSAHYWQFCNEAFGMVRGWKAGEFVKRPNALMFQLYSKHLFDLSLPVSISGPLANSIDKEAVTLSEAEKKENLLDGIKWEGSNPNVIWTVDKDETLSIEFINNDAFNFFHVSRKFVLPKNEKPCSYRLTAEIRTEGMEGTSGAQLEFINKSIDLSGLDSETVEVLSDTWVPVSAVYTPTSDEKVLTIMARRKNGGGKGKMFIRNMKLARENRHLVQGHVVDAFLSVSRDYRTAGLLLTNRSFAPEKVTFELSGPLAKRTIHSVVSDTLTGPNAYADNEKTANTVFLAPRKVTYSGKRVSVQLPPHSLTGITLRLQ